MSDDILLTIQPAVPPNVNSNAVNVRAYQIGGWTDISLTRSAESCPNVFSATITDKDPGKSSRVPVKPGDECLVYLGDDLVLTGYVGKVMPSVSSSEHSISITGRGRCQDLVDCNAVWPGGQVVNKTALSLAQALAGVYGISVSTQINFTDILPQFNIGFDELAFDIIERVCRYEQCLCYEDANGNLVLANVGTVRAASGVVEGANMQAASAVFDMDSRYSEYNAMLLSMATMDDIGEAGYLLSSLNDAGVYRRRVKNIIAETVGGVLSAQLAQKRIQWEMNRRNGRAQSITAVVDSWRDSAGNLWQPNTLIDVVVPSCKVDTTAPGAAQGPWVIGEVTYIRNEGQGDSAQLTMMPPSAFSPQPTLLISPFPDVPILTPAPQQ